MNNKKTSFRPTLFQVVFGILAISMLLAFSTSHVRGYRLLTFFSTASSAQVGPVGVRHK